MGRLIRIFVILLIIAALLLGVGAGVALWAVRRPLPQLAGVLALPGLDSPVTVYRDSLGVPHIYAASVEDLFYAQGVVHAQDRWWQMEFQRHVGLGRIGELTGYNETVLRNDMFIRTVGWNRSAEADVQALTPESRRVVNAYSRGVNAYIEGKSGPELAVEYALLGVTGVSIPVEPWEPLHTAAWTKALAWDLTVNMSLELTLADLYKRLGEAAGEMINGYFMPPFPYDAHPSILHPEDVPGAVDEVMRHSPPIRAPGVELSRVETALIGLPPGGLGEVAASNSAAISGARTASGKPILLNDPHLNIVMPSYLYQIGLHCEVVTIDCPYDVTGYSLPGAPGVLIGHNRHIAWGLTTPYVDTQDLYILKVSSRDDTQYEVDGKLETMQVIRETIRFGDGTPPRTIRVRVTRFGPVITDSPTHSARSDQPLALRWTVLDGPHDLISALLGINRATNWGEFRAALRNWTTPSQNFVYADAEGNIGYQLPGRVPIRAAEHSGLTPVDGSTTRYDWRGYIPYEYLPSIYNPARGYIIAANQRIAPLEYNRYLAARLDSTYGAGSNYVLDLDPDFGYRAKRLDDLIQRAGKLTTEAAKTILTDNYNSFAPDILPATLRLNLGPEAPKDLIDWMGQWDYQSNVGSAQAAVFELFWSRLLFNIWTDQVGYMPGGGSRLMAATKRLMNDPANAWWDNIGTPEKVESRDDILRLSFNEALSGAFARMGSDTSKWSWGALHQAKFVSNPLGASGIGLIEDLVNAGPVPVGGSIATLNRATWVPETGFTPVSVTQMRMIIDFGDMANNVWILATGQSGHPASHHYRDQIERWATLQFEPMRSTRERIEAAATNTLSLQPKAR